MEPQGLNRLADLSGRDLAGWVIAQGHCLELDHGLMGAFPAIDAATKEMIVTLDKINLQMVWRQLERRSAKVTSFMVIAHPASGIAFDLEDYCLKSETKPLRLFSTEEIGALCQKRGSMEWAEGLLDMSRKTVRDPVFD